MHFLIYLQLGIIILVVFLVLQQWKKTQSDYWLLVFFLLMGISVGTDFISDANPISLLLSIVLLYLTGPVFYHYILSVFAVKITKKSYWHFMPLLFTPLLLFPFLVGKHFQDTFWFNLFVFTSLASVLYYGAAALNFLVKHQAKALGNPFKMSYKKGKWIIYTYLFYFSISIIFALSADTVTEEKFTGHLENFLDLFALGFISLFSFQLSVSSKEKEIKRIELPRKNGTEVTQEAIKFKKIFDKIDTLICTEKLFLDQNFTIEKLTKRTGINAKYISKAVNISRKKSFSNYINDYRIETFKNKVKDPKNAHLNLSVLALESGFNAKSSFNRIFKKNTGITPSEFVGSLNSDE